MKKILFYLIFTLGFALDLLAQINPVKKSLCIYIKGMERQVKLDTIFVFYDNVVLHKYHIPNINNVKIIEVNSYQPNQTVVKLRLEEFGNRKLVVVVENVIELNEKTEEFDIFTSAVIHVNFKETNGRWKYKSKKVIKL